MITEYPRPTTDDERKAAAKRQHLSEVEGFRTKSRKDKARWLANLAALVVAPPVSALVPAETKKAAEAYRHADALSRAAVADMREAEVAVTKADDEDREAAVKAVERGEQLPEPTVPLAELALRTAQAKVTAAARAKEGAARKVAISWDNHRATLQPQAEQMSLAALDELRDLVAETHERITVIGKRLDVAYIVRDGAKPSVSYADDLKRDLAALDAAVVEIAERETRRRELES